MLVDRSARDLLDAFSSSDPTPGGGSAAALASALGTSLLMMVASLPKTRSGSEAERTALAASAAVLGGLRDELTDAIDADTTAYMLVVASYRLPKTSSEEKESRQASIQAALRAATDVPLTVMRLSALALEEAVHVAAHGHRPAISDVGVAIGLLRAGLHGARLNAEINTSSLSDATYVATVKVDVGRWRERGSQAADAADLRIGEK